MGNEIEFNKQPGQYAPGQSPAMMNDPISLALMMFGPQFINQMGGPGMFLPHQTPSQGVMDNFMSSRYQQDMMANLTNAASQGNAQVSTKIAGFMRLLTGQHPSEMNKGQQDFFAGIVNNPIMKSVIGQAIGPENMEGILFGKKGDPAALASAVNRMGAFRAGPTGNRDQMGAQDLTRFTQSLHSTLYGSGADINDMRGLMAGQTGQLMNHLFQRGSLPASIGMMKPADRAKLVSGQTYDETAVDSAAREVGHRDMMNNSAYAAAGKDEQQRMLDNGLDRYRTVVKSAGRLGEHEDAMARDIGHQDMMQQASYAKASVEERRGMLDQNLGRYKKVLQAVDTESPERRALAERKRYEQELNKSQADLDEASKKEDYTGEKISRAFRDAAKTKLKTFDLAQASGIAWDPKGFKATTVGNVPININGADVKPEALSEEDLESVISATQVGAKMRGSQTPEEAARLKTYQATLAARKAGAPQLKPPPAPPPPNSEQVRDIARDMAREDLAKKDPTFAAASATEQAKRVEAKMAPYVERAQNLVDSSQGSERVRTAARNMARTEMAQQDPTFATATPEEQESRIDANLGKYTARVRQMSDDTAGYKKRTGSSLRDDETLTRLAREFGHQQEMIKDKDYAAATEADQRQLLEKKVPEYRERLTSTLDQIDELNSQDGRRMSPEEREKKTATLERSEEYKTLATHVDAKKVGSTIKEYAGAVAAVREIFGDNGNTNAPMSALLSALEQLSGGATSQMKPAKVESTLREMRLAAKETGVGIEQMMGFAGQMSAMGDTLGIARPLSLSATRDVLTHVSAMDAGGAFSKERFGAMSKSEAMQEAGVRTARGMASPAQKTMAAIARAVAENPEKYKGTETEAMVNAYNNPQSRGMYTYNGETRNLNEMLGRGGPQAAASVFEQNGGNLNTLRAYYHDKGTQEFQQTGGELETQKYEMQRVMQQRMSADVAGLARKDKFKDAAKGVFGSANDKDFRRASNAFVQDVSKQLTEALATEGADLEQKDRPRFLQDKAKGAVTDAIMRQNPNLSKDQAEKEADKLIPLMFGESFEDRRDSFGRMAANVNAHLEQLTNKGLTGNSQIYGATALAAEKRVMNENKAKRMANVARGNESPMAARIGEVLDAMGRGENMDLPTAIKKITGMLSVDEMTKAYAPELAEAIVGAGAAYNNASFSEDQIKGIADKVRKDPTDATAARQLKQLAMTRANVSYVKDDVITDRLKAFSEEELTSLYQKEFKKDATGLSKEQMAGALASTATGRRNVLGKNEASRSQLEEQIDATKLIDRKEIQARLSDATKFDDKKIDELYKRAFPRGTATDRASKAAELADSRAAVAASGVLGENEASLEDVASSAMTRAFTAAGFTPEEIKRNSIIMRQAESLTAGLMNGGDADLVASGAAEGLRLIMQDGATPEVMEAMKAVARSEKGSKEADEAMKTLQNALGDDPRGKQVTMYATALRDAKNAPLNQVRQDKTQEQMQREAADKKTQAQETGAMPTPAPTTEGTPTQSGTAPATAGAPASGGAAAPEEKKSWGSRLFDAIFGSPQDDKKRQDRAKDAQASSVTGADQVTKEAARQSAREVQAQRDGTGGKGGKMEISGKLEVNGLREAVLAAMGDHPQETPGDGANVI